MDNESHEELVTVYTASNAVDLAFAKSVLDSANITYFAKGENLQNLFGWGTVGLGYNPAVGPIELQVSEQNAPEAGDLLADMPGNAEAQAEVVREATARQVALVEKLNVAEHWLRVGLIIAALAAGVLIFGYMIYGIIQTFQHAP